MTESRSFPLCVVLSVTTGRLLSVNDNGIGDLYEFLKWMTDDAPFTYQLGRFSEECKPWLLRWFPELAQANEMLSDLDARLEAGKVADGIASWLRILVEDYGCKPAYDVSRIPADNHERKDPYDELVIKRGTDEGIVVIPVSE
jgi:hypothetical protein